MSSSPADAGEFILGAQGTRLSRLVAEIAAASDLPALTLLAPGVRATGCALLELDAGSGLATRTIAQLNDLLAERVITVVAEHHRLPSAAWCWLSMGSEGRCEQTLATDQDNGLLFSAAPGEAEELRRLFIPFAQQVNAGLAACGFSFCPGEIMARNPHWCLSFDEWSNRFAGWVRTPDPEALLNASIFFDFRPICGDVALATALRGKLLGLTEDNSVILRMMAANALAVAPPLGLLGDVVVDDRGGVDLKKFGARIFVDAARILALATGMSPVNTIERLRAAAAQGAIAVCDADAAIQAFAQLQYFRLDAQRRALASGGPAGNWIVPRDLNEFGRRMLRAILRQAKSLQQHLRTAFAIET
jgi:CBS domain-containing protein